MAPSGAKRSVRANEPAPRGKMGRHFTSPLKAGDTRKRKPALALGHAMKLAEARDQLNTRLNKAPHHPRLAPESSSPGPSPPSPPIESQPGGDAEWVDKEALQVVLPSLPTTTANKAAKHRRIFDSWEQLLPLLEDPFAGYYRMQQKGSSYIVHVRIVTCECMYLGVLLVQHGVFPASPNRPRIGISLDVLDLYRAMFEQSCNAITALAAALRTVYNRRGFTVVSERNPLDRVADPFHTSLTHAVQLSCNLRDCIDRKLHMELSISEQALLPGEAGDRLTEPSAPSTPPRNFRTILTLRTLCTILTLRGSFSYAGSCKLPLDQGRDVQLGADGCFSYCHLRSAGDGLIGYTPSFCIPQHKLDTVVSKIAQARDNPRANVQPSIPQDAIDGCEATFEAANEKVQRGDPKWYDASGVFLMACRHGQILFFSNIYTLGEQQRYIVASIEELVRQLPPQATILQAYDIGCVVDHSLDLYPILGDNLRNRVAFIINHMHSYRHEWACQVTFGPCFRPGAGIADHEDMERV
ncbi:hypothetical protein MVEN_02281600 [Mycena venus]|uniref:Uncharacterized protein n=1 Tax=Mycena venus TaxID=2733690 RepID=A0A8H6X5H1_9AGAR|nr:hypothetical protein MVEN_02281600 [Mycena venus]